LADSTGRAPDFGLHPPDVLDNALSMAYASRSAPAARRVRRGKIFVYPDPPIKSNELLLLQKLVPQRRHLSLIEWRALRAAKALTDRWDTSRDPRPNPFRKLRIGISVSAAETWAELGLIGQHQEELTRSIALEIILLGAKVIWGGDLRPEGFGSQLQRIVRTYQHPLHSTQDHVGLFVPFSPDPKKLLTVEDLQSRRMFADVHVLENPLGSLLDRDLSVASAQARAVALAAVAFSMMRVELAAECDARIVVGGNLHSFMGLYPGIAEEAFEAVRKNKPLYVLAGFGGAAQAVYRAIRRSPAGCAKLIDVSHKVGAAKDPLNRREHEHLIAAINRPKLKFDPESMVREFWRLGLAGLAERNGLSREENERLAESQNVHEILELLVKGLSAVRRRKKG
jgi:hypothetical protein